MQPPPTLADHIRRQRVRHDRPALILPGAALRYGDLGDQVEAIAATLAGPAGPHVRAGPAPLLALHAAAAGRAGRAFWPRPAHSADAPAPGPVPAGIALIIATSGSEGASKAVLLSHGNLEAAAQASEQRLPLAPGDLWLDCLPLHHIGGLAILWRCFRAGATVLLHDGFAPERIAADLARHPVTHLSLVPAMLARLVAADIRPPPSLRAVLVGGAALAEPLWHRASRAGWPLLPSYGMSETSAQLATWDPAAGPWQAGRVGHPLPGNAVAIGDDGRIRVRGPQVMAGYLDASGQTGVGLEDGWFTTGDLGRLDAAGRLTVLGRADDVLVSGGENIHPLTVESCLAACPGVADVAVSARPDDTWGDLLVALVVGVASAEGIAAWSRQHLPAAARPRRIIHVASLPRNAMGKLDRRALRPLAAGAQP